MLPAGSADPRARARRHATNSVIFAARFFDRGKPVAVICHGPWTLVEAGLSATA